MTTLGRGMVKHPGLLRPSATRLCESLEGLRDCSGLKVSAVLPPAWGGELVQCLGSCLLTSSSFLAEPERGNPWTRIEKKILDNLEVVQSKQPLVLGALQQPPQGSQAAY